MDSKHKRPLATTPVNGAEGDRELVQQLADMQRWLQTELARLSPEEQAQIQAMREKLIRFSGSDVLDA